MAKMRECKAENSSGGYKRVFGDEEVGRLMTKVQSTVIANGYELEKIISAKFESIPDLDAFLDGKTKQENKLYNCQKNILKSSEKYNKKGFQPDLLIFDNRDTKLKCFVVELKDGDAFDTKKSEGEITHIKKFCRHLRKLLKEKNIPVKYYFCCFNAINKDSLVDGFKDFVSKNNLLTGKEFCKIMGFNYEEIVSSREADQPDNLEYFAIEFNKIPAVQKVLEKQSSGAFEEAED